MVYPRKRYIIKASAPENTQKVCKNSKIYTVWVSQAAAKAPDNCHNSQMKLDEPNRI
jgi:hypothetical protein